MMKMRYIIYFTDLGGCGNFYVDSQPGWSKWTACNDSIRMLPFDGWNCD